MIKRDPADTMERLRDTLRRLANAALEARSLEGTSDLGLQARQAAAYRIVFGFDS